MSKFNYKNSDVEIDEIHNVVKIDGEEHPIRKTDAGYTMYYFEPVPSAEEAVKTFIDRKD